MSTVGELIRTKGPDVATIEPEAMVLDAARMMNAKRIGALVVVEGDRTAGIVTERDIMTRVVASELDPASTKVRQIMTTPIITCSEETTVEEVRSVMRSKRIRHVPVVRGSSLAGIVSIGDLNTAEVKIMSETIGYLEQYMYRG